MPYADFTLESVEAQFALTTGIADLFPGLPAVAVPGWLREQLDRGRAVAALVSEKARSEFLVAPVLLACRELVAGELAIYSGQRLDIDATQGLTGECDYLLALTAPVPRLRAPLVTVLEAKRGDLELGLGQCVAQLVGARLFNERAGVTGGRLHGVVTTGEAWQFLRLEGPAVTLHPSRLFIDDLGAILAAFASVLTRLRRAASASLHCLCPTRSPRMNATVAAPWATLDDLARHDGKAELIDGKVVPLMATGFRPNVIAGRVFRSLADYADAAGRGYALTDNMGFAVPELRSGRESFSPDAAYYTGPLPANLMRFVVGPPDFAAEVRSDGDSGPAAEAEMAAKRADYFEAGTLVVWDVDVREGVVRRYRVGEAGPAVFTMGSEADAEPAVPGWRVAVDWLLA